MITLNTFRKTMDGSIHNQEIIPLLRQVLDQELNIEFGNSIFHALSLLNESHLTYSEWKSFYETTQDKFRLSQYNDTTYHTLIKMWCSTFGCDYLLETEGEMENIIQHLLEEMYQRDMVYRRRTLAPIFMMCYCFKLTDLMKNTYLLAQVNHLTLEPIDLAYILNTSVDPTIRRCAITDLLKYPSSIDMSVIEFIQKGFPTAALREVDGVLEEVPIPKFQLSKKDISTVCLSLRSHVDNITHGRKKITKLYDTFIQSLRKKKYTVVVDGANLGRYDQGKNSQGDLNFSQIELGIRTLSERGERVMLVINEQHLQTASSNSQKSIRNIQEIAEVLPTPRGLDDDLFWLYAAVCKVGVKLLTNDEIRNHIHYIDGRFVSWKQYSRITYQINKNKDRILFQSPPPFEVRTFYDKARAQLYLPISQQDWYRVTIN